MPQGPLKASIANNAANAGVQLGADPSGLLLVTTGGTKSALNQSAAAVIKATPGRVAKVVIVTAGSGGAFTLNDCATTGAAAASNEFFTCVGTTVAGTTFSVDWPCLTGIVLSAIGTSTGVCAISYT